MLELGAEERSTAAAAAWEEAPGILRDTRRPLQCSQFVMQAPSGPFEQHPHVSVQCSRVCSSKLYTKGARGRSILEGGTRASGWSNAGLDISLVVVGLAKRVKQEQILNISLAITILLSSKLPFFLPVFMGKVIIFL